MHIEEIRHGLRVRLAARRTEIAQEAMERVSAVSDPREARDPQYTEGLRIAVIAAVDYGIEALERSGERSPSLPTALLSQARLAARNGIPLDTVLRRYLAGYTLLGDFVIEEAERAGISDGLALKRLLRTQAAIFDRLIDAVAEEYGREAERPRSSEERRAERIERLLAGKRTESAELAYELDRWHTGILVSGAGAEESIKRLATRLDARMLTVRREEGILWAWLGSRRRIDPDDVRGLLPELPTDLRLAIGEPGEGVAGWRLSHRQAAAALSVALRGGERFVRYADVAMLAAALQDELLCASLCQLYLEPLARDRDGGAVLLETLRAYFAAGRNVSSAASVLGVNRNTVASRLRAIEERLDRSLDTCGTDLEVAMRLEASGRGRPSSMQHA